MRAIAYDRFGGPEVLQLVDLPTPPVGPDAVLVRARASSVNPVDWKVRQGYLQAFFPHNFPIVPGWDVSGVVEQVGPAVTEFAPGDEVVGYVRRDDVQWGTFAELVPAPVRTLAKAPTGGTGLVEAAGLPLAGLTALQALRAAGVGEGDTVLVHAAAGGVGTFAVQLAHVLGARVLGTAGESSAQLVRDLGGEPLAYGEGLADRVRDLAGGPVDVALDFVGGDALVVSPQLVKDPGRVVSVIDPTVKEQGGRYVFVRPSASDLTELVGHLEAGTLRVVVDGTFPLERAADAHRRSEEGHVHGKLLVTI
ncbi:NADP-dependent oxidoreductase [Motilibacter aurantiacus]|uniref:NADP-dependent oxidoreductase n=1 Tax=Motilibacter aurantiacus TaxID=2714955 RepID=UPI00140CADFA|nr:NADP-dependent oxidoreductase [Motilibacter aurantiacus]